MKKFKNHTLVEYLAELAKKAPVPGGGSVAALTAALAAGLISMVANYSVGRKIPLRDVRRLEGILKKSEALRVRLLELVDLDAEAYLQVVAAKGQPPRIKRQVLRAAARVPAEVARLCYQTMLLAPFLIDKGNPYLLSDVEVAVELLEAAFKSAMINVRVNQA